MLYIFGGLLILSTIWAYSLWKGLSFNREMRNSWAQVGDQFYERFTISNKSFFSAQSVSLFDESNIPGYDSNYAWEVKQRFDKMWYMDSFCYIRGLYNVGPTKIQTNDPLGVFEINIDSSHSEEILVTPPILPLLQIDISAGELQGDGGAKASILDRTVTSGNVREYNSGDSLYSVHWLTSARRGKLFVKTFDKNPSSDWWIFLDMENSVQAGQNLNTTDEYAAILAASIADRGLKENRPVGLVSEGSNSLWLPPKTGSGQRSEIMHGLAVANRGNVPLHTLLAKSQRSMGQKSSAIIITPSFDKNWLNSLSTLRQRGVLTTVLLLDAKKFGGDGDSSTIMGQLSAWGIKTYLIGPDFFEQISFNEKNSDFSIIFPKTNWHSWQKEK